MGRRSRQYAKRRERTQHEPTAEREALERRLRRACVEEPQLATLVTGAELRTEPYHRWLAYKQAYAPELVRQFLTTGAGGRSNAILLDPFSGSGTLAIECARQGYAALGIESLPSLVYLTNAAGVREIPPLPDLRDGAHWREYADQLEMPIHRAILMLCVGKQFTSDGKPRRDAPALSILLDALLAVMHADLRQAMRASVRAERGDARDLSRLADGSVGGILTSPPYLSRHDYTKVVRPYERVYRHWYPDEGTASAREAQIRAHPRAYAQTRRFEMPPTVDECCAALLQRNATQLSGIVRSYFEDMFMVLQECGRVLESGASLWLVIGGARPRDVYIPSDLILAEFAESCGFQLSAVRVARRLIASGRKLGTLSNVAPRESVVVLERT